jgi:hypothetical protein
MHAFTQSANGRGFWSAAETAEPSSTIAISSTKEAVLKSRDGFTTRFLSWLSLFRDVFL